MKKLIVSALGKILPEGVKDSIRTVLFGKSVEEVQIVEQLFGKASGSEYTMLDVGAHYGSACIPFAQKGWKVFAFEPDSNNRKFLVENSKDLSNIQIDTRAVSFESDKSVPFYSSSVSTGISGLSSFHESHRKAGEVKTVRLDDFCAQHGVEKVNFLKIDTEGYDLMVLKSFGWEKQVHPEFIVAEFENRKTRPLGYTLADMVEYLKDKGYAVLISEWHPIVQYGSRHKWNRFTWDHSAIDNDLAWGNIIACKAENVDRLKAITEKT